MREALESLRPVDRAEARHRRGHRPRVHLSEFERPRRRRDGEITADDPMPTLVEEVAPPRRPRGRRRHRAHAVEDTFHTDWASRAREALGVPVLHMYAGDWRLG